MRNGGKYAEDKENVSVPIACQYTLRENVDVLDNSGHWVNGEVVEIRGNKLKIHYSGMSRQFDFKIICSSPRIQKQWTGIGEFKKNNRVDMMDKTGQWYEAIVIDTQPRFVVVADIRNSKNTDIVRENSDRIAPIGTYSGAFGTGTESRVASMIANNRESNGARKPLGEIRVGDKTPELRTPITLNLRQREIQFISVLESKGLKIKEVEGDGNCLFRAIADQLYGTEAPHEIIRNYCMDYMEIEKEFFKDYIIGGAEGFSHYIENKRKSGVWGDDPEIEALSEIYGFPIEIFAYSDKPMRTFHEGSSGTTSIRKVMLSYHGRSHYNSIIPLKEKQIPILTRKPEEIEKLAIEFAQNRALSKTSTGPRGKEEEKIPSKISQSRAHFVEYGSRSMESAFLEAILATEDKLIESAKKISEEQEIDKDYTQIAVKSSKKELEEKEQSQINEAIMASMMSEIEKIPPSVRTIMAHGFPYELVMEAYQIVGDNPDYMMNYLLDNQ